MSMVPVMEPAFSDHTLAALQRLLPPEPEPRAESTTDHFGPFRPARVAADVLALPCTGCATQPFCIRTGHECAAFDDYVRSGNFHRRAKRARRRASHT
jgi:hypothetical protein